MIMMTYRNHVIYTGKTTAIDITAVDGNAQNYAFSFATFLNIQLKMIHLDENHVLHCV